MPDFPPELLRLLREADAITVLTGAGVSTESGIPTFRDALSGYWARFNPEELATPEAFHRDSALVSQWYDERRCAVAKCKPNAGHAALVDLQRKVLSDGRRFTLVTQNVDRLHQTAGATDVIELHGSLWTWRCLDCGVEGEERGPAFAEHPPTCACGGYKRPGVVWFGEPLPSGVLRRAEAAASSCQLFLSLGTSGVVYPAAGLMDLALASGATLCEVNPHETPYSSRATWHLAGKSGDVLPRMLQAAWE